MALDEELAALAAAAAAHAGEGEQLEAVIPAEPAPGRRVYLCAFAADGRRSWLALDADGEPVSRRDAVREAVSIAALCELAEESAGGGDLDELRARLVALRITEDPPGLDAAERAVDELQRALGRPPRLASPAYLDAVGQATRRLEQALGDSGPSPFATAMTAAAGAVEELWREVESGYKTPLR